MCICIYPHDPQHIHVFVIKEEKHEEFSFCLWYHHQLKLEIIIKDWCKGNCACSIQTGLDIDESKIPIVWKSTAYWLEELNDCANVLFLVQHPQRSKIHVGKLHWKIYKGETISSQCLKSLKSIWHTQNWDLLYSSKVLWSLNTISSTSLKLPQNLGFLLWL